MGKTERALETQLNDNHRIGSTSAKRLSWMGGPYRCMGVNPSAPGWEGILIEPKAWYIGEIEGSAVTPRGRT